jgi:hypothetical protein
MSLHVLDGVESGLGSLLVQEPASAIGIEGLDVVDQLAQRLELGGQEKLEGDVPVLTFEGLVDMGLDRLGDRLIAGLEGDLDLPAHGRFPAFNADAGILKAPPGRSWMCGSDPSSQAR